MNKIIQKLAKIKEELVIEKTGYDERNEYYYFKADDIAAAVRQAMIKEKVIHRTTIVSHSIENIIDKQRIRPFANALYEVEFIDVESGEVFATQAVASGSDVGGDKATRKLAVQAFKIVCIDLFSIAEGGMKGFDSDDYAEQPVLDNGTDEPVAEAEKKPDSKALGAQLTEMIKDPGQEHITGEVAVTVGRRVAQEVLGETPRDSIWKKDARVLEPLIEQLEKGALD